MTGVSSAQVTIWDPIHSKYSSLDYEPNTINILIDGATSALEKVKRFLESVSNRLEQSTSSIFQEGFSYSTETSLYSLNYLNRLTIKNVDYIISFLSRNNEIIVPVLYGCKLAADNFDLNTQLSLEIYSDPEYGDESLRLYVRQEDYEDEIMDKIDQIYKYYHKDLIGLSADFFVTTDFQPPQ